MRTLLFLALSAVAMRAETGFLDRQITTGGTACRYQVYVPATYSADREWPIILFLHGSGERGADGLLQTAVGLPQAIRQHADRYPAIVVIPQCRRGVWWQAPAMTEMAMAALDASAREFRTDPKRTYLTGLSMGGYGSWAIAQQFPKRFAAVAPVCGGVAIPRNYLPDSGVTQDKADDPYAEAAKKLGSTPIWIFHGSADTSVPVAESRKMNEALKAAGGNVKYTEYEGVGHNSWDKAYAEPAFAQWLFEQRLP